MKVTVEGSDLSKDDLKALLQAIRDCELQNFREKNIHIMADAPELTRDEILGVMNSIDPPYEHGPVVFDRKDMEWTRGRRGN